MKKIVFLCLFVLVSVLNASTSLQKGLDNLIIMTENYPPISFKDKNGRADGLASEVAHKIMKQLHMKQKILVLPWARDYKLLQKGPNYLVFSTSRTKIRDKQFQWVGPIYSMKTGFYARKDSKIKINSLEDAKHLAKIGTYLASFDQQYLKSKSFNNLESTRNNVLNVRKLMHHRFNVITATNVTIKDIVNQAGYKMSDIKDIYDFLNVGVYFTFSKQVPFEVVTAWREELEKMREDGSLQKIRNKWLK